MEGCNDIEERILGDEGRVYWDVMTVNTLRVSLRRTRLIEKGAQEGKREGAIKGKNPPAIALKKAFRKCFDETAWFGAIGG